MSVPLIFAAVDWAATLFTVSACYLLYRSRKRLATARLPEADTCLTGCDPDCDAACHEIHVPFAQRTHQPWQCDYIVRAVYYAGLTKPRKGG